MTRGACIAAMAFVLLAAQGRVSADEDPRTPVSLPPDVMARFLAEMRSHMVHLDDLVTALAEEDFAQAARIADIHMTFGHHRWAAMAEAGASDAEIAAAKARFKQRRASQGGGHGGGMGMGPGFGRHMPEDFRAMGAMFHEAAEAFAETARSVAAPVTPADYRAVLAALQEVTVACRSCHDAFRVEAAP